MRFGSAMKTNLPDPNVANIIRDRVIARCGSNFFGLYNPAVWITGSTVWRALYGMPYDATSDIDLFFLDADAYRLWVARTVPSIELKPSEGYGRPQPAKSRGETGGEGRRFLTDVGWVDAWTDPTITDPFAMLETYPSSGYTHCRAAIRMADRALVVLPNNSAAAQLGGPYR